MTVVGTYSPLTLTLTLTLTLEAVQRAVMTDAQLDSNAPLEWFSVERASMIVLEVDAGHAQ